VSEKVKEDMNKMKTNVYVEFYGEQVSKDELVKEAEKIWVESGKKAADIKKIDLYVKPEEDKAYYVINDEMEGSFHIINTQNDI
jgi:hypothetical protein